ncbi:MAG: hypothetical protein M1814_006046 [Vezdaea aestivalis]|nr:MAG: hypothetical protein M1814_006046 [Vezdaea aestivalis]
MPDVESLLENVSRQITFSKLSRHHSNRQTSDRRCPRSMEAKRILKVSSTGNSPRKNERRKYVNSAFSSQRSSFVEGARQHQASIAFRQSTQQSRPTTWHPTGQPGWDTIDAAGSSPLQPQLPFLMAEPWNLSYQASNAPTSMPQCTPITPIQPVTDDSRSHQHSTNYERHPVSYPVQQMSTWQPQYYQPNIYPQFSNSLYPFDTALQPYLDYQAPNSTFPFSSVPSTPEDVFTLQKSSLLFDSDQLFDKIADPDEETTGTELVGMGLYDDRKEPAARAVEFGGDPSVMMSRLLSGSDLAMAGTVGKGLKLEETWEPPEDDQENVESDASDDGQAREDDVGGSSDTGFVEGQLALAPSHRTHLAEDGTLIVPADAAGSLDGGWI